MSRFYTILTTGLFNVHNINKIPRTATTHYAYSVYPTHDVPTALVGAIRKPIPARKIFRNKMRPSNITETFESANVARAPKPKITREKSINTDINRPTLAEYFENRTTPTYAEQKQENLDAMVAELEQDQATASSAATIDKYLGYEKLGATRNIKNEFDKMEQRAELYDYVMAQKLSAIFDNANVIAIVTFEIPYDLTDFPFKAKLDPSEWVFLRPHKTEYDMSNLITNADEINASIKDKFIKKHNGIQSAAVMCVFEKEKQRKQMLREQQRRIYRSK